MPKVPKQYTEARTAEILEAAAIRFARGGYIASSMAEIAQTSGLSVGSLYRYFPSKEELFRTLTRSARSMNRSAWESVKSKGGPEEQIKAFVKGYMEMLADPKCRPTLALDTRLRGEAIDSEVVAEELKISYRTQIATLSNLLRSSISGAGRKNKADARARVVIGFLIEAGFNVLTDERFDLKSYERAILQIIESWTRDQ